MTISNMHDIHDKYSLISKLFKSYSISNKPFNPYIDWEHKYLDLDTVIIQNGSLEDPRYSEAKSYLKIKRKKLSGEMAELSITGVRDSWEMLSLEIDKKYKNHILDRQFYYTVNAHLNCYTDELSTPKSWYYNSKVSKKINDSPYLYSGLNKEFVVKDKKLFIRCNHETSQLNLSENYTCKWCLLAAAQQMSGSGKKSINFTLIDEYDSISDNQIFRFRESVQVETANGLSEVKCFEHLGIGTQPATLWVDKTGRLLFYISGMQLLILTEENGEKLFSRFTYKN